MSETKEAFTCPHCGRLLKGQSPINGHSVSKVLCACGQSVPVPAWSAPPSAAADEETASVKPPLSEESSIEDQLLEVLVADDQTQNSDASSSQASPDARSSNQNPNEPDNSYELSEVDNTTERCCPLCNNPIAHIDTVICTNCGADLRTGLSRMGYKDVAVLQAQALTQAMHKEDTKFELTGAGLVLQCTGGISILAGLILKIALITIGTDIIWGETITVICDISLLAGLILFGISPILCVVTPSDSGRRNTIWAAVGCYIVGVVLAVAVSAVIQGEQSSIWTEIVGAAANTFLLSATSLFLGFLLELSLFLDDDLLYWRINILLKIAMTLAICSLLAWITILGAALLWALLGAEFVFLVIYLWVIFQVHHALHYV